MFRSPTYSLLLVIVAGMLVACSPQEDVPDTFIDPANRLTADEGRRLMAEGKQAIAKAEADIDRGKMLVKDARKRRKEAEAIASRGRQALRAAAMAEEAERLALKAEALKGAALPSGQPNR